jgi:hypothetical protein
MHNRFAPTLRADGTVYLSELRDRGWTPSMVRTFLADPDHASIRRPSGTTAAAARWSLDRVLEAEQSAEFAAALQIAQERTARGRATVTKRKEPVIEWARTVPIALRRVSCAELESSVIRWWNTSMERQADSDALPTDEMMPRMKVNHLRHQCSNYERLLDRRAKEPGVVEARWIIRERIYAAIAKAYPDLASEAAAQLARRRAEDPHSVDRYPAHD